jgi:CheY-like chemotaxis protein
VGLAPGEPQYRILIVEDQRDNQALLAHLMVGVGLQTKIAENGKQGVELFQSWHPHLIFMDRRMPVMDGEEATRRIRELPGGREVKIIAVTASAFKEQRKKMLEAGLDDFVSKPFRAGEIYDCLTNQLGIRFLCEGVTEPQKLLTLTPEMLSALPEAMCNKLQEALESLESERIDQVIQQVAAHDQKLLKTLLQYTDNFDYQTILEALRKV